MAESLQLAACYITDAMKPDAEKSPSVSA